MTTEKWMVRLAEGDESALGTLCENNQGLIHDRARQAAEERPGNASAFSDTQKTPLCDIAMYHLMKEDAVGKAIVTVGLAGAVGCGDRC